MNQKSTSLAVLLSSLTPLNESEEGQLKGGFSPVTTSGTTIGSTGKNKRSDCSTSNSNTNNVAGCSCSC